MLCYPYFFLLYHILQTAIVLQRYRTCALGLKWISRKHVPSPFASSQKRLFEFPLNNFFDLTVDSSSYTSSSLILKMGFFSRNKSKKASSPQASPTLPTPSASPTQSSSLIPKNNNNIAVTDLKRLEHQNQLLQKHGIVERNPERKSHPVHRLVPPLFKGINNDSHLIHEARETQGVVFEGKRDGFNLVFKATPVEKYQMKPHTRRHRWGTTNKTTGELMESGKFFLRLSDHKF
jgi:hypothetical protein